MMLESNPNLNQLPYRARIMMHANSDGGRRVASDTDKKCVINAGVPLSLQGDLQPLQWLQRETILAISPLDHEEEFVAGREEIVNVDTSPVKVEIVSDYGSVEEPGSERSTTIEDFYRYQAMRAALASVSNNNGFRGGQICVSRPAMSQSTSAINEYQKPPFSYTHIIFMAIETSPHKAMTVNDIYMWCESHFPYYTQAGVGWKNSLRHNLSINKSFKKISRDGRGGPGRGAYWVVEPRERNNLIDAIRRSPCSLGHFPFLNSMYPWGSGNCFSNTFLQSSNSFNTNLTPLCSTRSLISNKANHPMDINTASCRGPLLRIGGQITDASQLICSSPVIQRLNESSNIIELSKTPQIISTLPLLQLEQIKFESDAKSRTEGSMIEDIANCKQYDDINCKGIVVVKEDSNENYEYDHIFKDITRGLIENELMDRSDSGRTESIKLCRDHPKKRDKLHVNHTCDAGAVVEDHRPSEESASLSHDIVKRHYSIKHRKKCSCIKYNESESEDQATANEDYSEQSDTDFNLRRSLGHGKHNPQTKCFLLSKLKYMTKHRKLNCRSRLNNVIMAPHLDHVYAFLQESSTNSSENVKPRETNLENCTENESFPVVDDEKSTDLSLLALSKRSKHKLQIRRGSSKGMCSDSDNECRYNVNVANTPMKLSQYSISPSEVKQEATSSKPISNLWKKNSKDDNLHEFESDLNYDEDEERENIYYEDDDNHDTTFNNINKMPFLKNEEQRKCCRGSNHSSNQLHSKEECLTSIKKSQSNRDLFAPRRKVGRPKKSDCDSTVSCISKEHHKSIDRISGEKLRKTVKLLKNEIKYLKESNSNKKLDSSFCNKDEQVAIDILVNLQRKSKQDRINNMYNLSNFISRNDSNVS